MGESDRRGRRLRTRREDKERQRDGDHEFDQGVGEWEILQQRRVARRRKKGNLAGRRGDDTAVQVHQAPPEKPTQEDPRFGQEQEADGVRAPSPSASAVRGRLRRQGQVLRRVVAARGAHSWNRRAAPPSRRMPWLPKARGRKDNLLSVTLHRLKRRNFSQ